MERNYESMLILKADLTDAEREEIFQKITKRIEGLEGKVELSKVWAKERNFYYPIRSHGAGKEKYTRGCYWLLQFNLLPEKLSDLKETVKLEERILREMTLKKD